MKFTLASLIITSFVGTGMGATIRINAYNTGDCGGLNTSFDGPNGGGNTCHTFNGVSYGAQYEVLSSATCVFKSWQNSDCTGLATVRTITGAGTNCIPIANDEAGNFHVPAGLQSVSITCA